MYLIILLIALSMLLLKGVKINILNPFFVFISIWILLILVYSLNLFRNFPKLEVYTWIFISLSLYLFVFGMFIGSKKRIEKIEEKNSEYDYKKLFNMSVLVLTLVMISFVITVLVLGLPPVLGGTVPRNEYYLSGLERLYLFIYVYWFISFYLIVNSYKIRLNLALITSSLIPVILKGNKFQIIIFILIFIFFYGLKNKKIKFNYIIISIFTILIIFYFTTKLYVSNSSSDLTMIRVNLVGYKGKGTLLLDPLLYFTNNLMNLNNFLIFETRELSYGLQSFSGVINTFNLNSIFESNISKFDLLWKESLQFKWLTTGSYLKTLLTDFGYIGAILINLPIGYFVGAIWKKIKVNLFANSLTTLYLYLITFICLSLSFFTSYFSSDEIIMNLILIKIIDIYCKKKRVIR